MQQPTGVPHVISVEALSRSGGGFSTDNFWMAGNVKKVVTQTKPLTICDKLSTLIIIMIHVVYLTTILELRLSAFSSRSVEGSV